MAHQKEAMRISIQRSWKEQLLIAVQYFRSLSSNDVCDWKAAMAA